MLEILGNTKEDAHNCGLRIYGQVLERSVKLETRGIKFLTAMAVFLCIESLGILNGLEISGQPRELRLSICAGR